VSEVEGFERAEEEFSSVYDEIPADLWGNR